MCIRDSGNCGLGIQVFQVFVRIDAFHAFSEQAYFLIFLPGGTPCSLFFKGKQAGLQLLAALLLSLSLIHI